MKIERAQKKKQKLKIALAGISGSGKTYSALTLAFSMCKKVCVIDTECGSASLYSDHFPEYDVLELSAPYSPQRYMQAIEAVEKAGYECIIIDSLSHEWNGAGGCLDMVQNIGGNSYMAWAKVTPFHDKLIQHMVSSRAHIIITMRSKAAYDAELNDKGKMAPKKIGLAPIQRDGVEYEFTFMFDMSPKGRFMCSKSRAAGLFDDMVSPELVTEETGKKMLAWLESGVEVVAPVANVSPVQPEPSLPNDITEEQYREVRSKFLIEAQAIREEYNRGDKDELCIGETWQKLVKDLGCSWYALCDKYTSEYSWFTVPPAWVDGMYKFFGDREDLIGEANATE